MDAGKRENPLMSLLHVDPQWLEVLLPRVAGFTIGANEEA